MKLFETYQKLLRFEIVRANLNPPNSKTATNSNKVHIRRQTFLPLSSYVWGLVSAGIFICFEAQTFTDYSHSFYAFGIISLNFSTCLFHISWVGRKIFNLIDKFESTIEGRQKVLGPKSNYEQANAFVEKWSKIIHTALMKVTLPAALLSHFCNAYFLYFTSDLKNEAFRLYYPTWMPFDWKNPFGYVIAFALQLPFICYAPLTIGCDVTIAVGFCYFLATLADDISENVADLNKQCNENNIDRAFNKKLTNFIEFHSTGKQLASDFNDTFKYIFMLCFIWGAFTICDTLLMMQNELMYGSSNIRADNWLILFMIMPWTLGILFVLCDAGGFVTGAFGTIDIYDQSEWYRFPNKVQRMLPMIISICQKQTVVQGFGNIICTRETYGKVVNNAFSYFVMLRNLLS